MNDEELRDRLPEGWLAVRIEEWNRIQNVSYLLQRAVHIARECRAEGRYADDPAWEEFDRAAARTLGIER